MYKLERAAGVDGSCVMTVLDSEQGRGNCFSQGSYTTRFLRWTQDSLHLVNKNHATCVKMQKTFINADAADLI